MAGVLERLIVQSEEDQGWIPPLENGDRLTRAEFERRYSAMPEVKKAELIEGVVYMPSPVSHVRHSKPHFSVIGWLSFYCMETPGVEGGDNASVLLDPDNEPQPDAFLMILPEYGGQVNINDQGYIDGSPELVVEVSASTVSKDVHLKLPVYRRNKVQEYVIWRVDDRQIDWYEWNEGRYDLIEPDAEGILHSRVFPGLALDINAAIAGDMKRVADVQRAACQSPGHAEFVSRLEAAKQGQG